MVLLPVAIHYLLVLSTLLSSARRTSMGGGGGCRAENRTRQADALLSSRGLISKPMHYQQAYALSASLCTISKPTHYQQAYALSASLRTISKPTHYQQAYHLISKHYHLILSFYSLKYFLGFYQFNFQIIFFPVFQ
jgi:hypothetical protein